MHEGYLLILPKKHFRSFAFIEEDLFEEANNFKNDIIKLIHHHFGSPIVFEHGYFSTDLTGGGCIDHAHLHLLPTKLDLLPELAKYFVPDEIGHLSELSKFRCSKQSYLYYERNDRKFVFAVDTKLPSQFVRRLIAKNEARPDEWDWEIFVGADKIIKTVTTLRKA